MPETADLSADDRALIERVAARVVELRLETPAILTLETARPLSVLAGQALIFLEPIVQSLLRMRDYRRFAALIERRETLAELTNRIEAQVELRERARAGARSASGSPPRP